MGILSGLLDPIFGDEDQNVTTRTELPPWLSDYGQWYTGLMRDFGQNSQYPGMAPFNEDQNNAFAAFRGQMNSPLMQLAEDAAMRTMRGDYLNGNPQLDNMVNQTMNDLQGRFNTTALGSGSFGNANVTQQGMQGMADAANTLRFNNYNAERGRQMDAMNMAPSLFGMRNSAISNVLGAGGLQQDYANQVLQGPFNFSAQLMGLLGAPLGYNMGNSQTQTLPGNTGLQNWMGLISAGAGLARGSMGGGR